VLPDTWPQAGWQVEIDTHHLASPAPAEGEHKAGDHITVGPRSLVVLKNLQGGGVATVRSGENKTGHPDERGGPDPGGAMRASITWYDLLGAMPDAPPEDIQRAYDAKAGLLRPELLAGAPSTVVAAAARAQGIIDAARQVLTDPVSRQRYNEAAGLWGSSGGGLTEPMDSPAGSGLPDSDVAAGNPGAGVLHGLGALNLWLDLHSDSQRRIPVPDVRGLFYDVFTAVVGRLDLRISFVQLTRHPMLVEGLVVDQSPGPLVKLHRRGELTVQVWHPPAQVTEDPPGASAAR
jgi:hypothetical protein